jgi:hypothetical protein
MTQWASTIGQPHSRIEWIGPGAPETVLPWPSAGAGAGASRLARVVEVEAEARAVGGDEAEWRGAAGGCGHFALVEGPCLRGLGFV